MPKRPVVIVTSRLFTLEFSVDNDAFVGNDATLELVRVLTEVATKLIGGSTEGPIRDSNGCKRGTYKLESSD